MIKMIEIFKTDIKKREDAKEVKQLLKEHFPESHINFDLEDDDNILRVENNIPVSENVIQMLQIKGYYCEELF